MTATSDNEPTLRELAEKLDKVQALESKLDKIAANNEKFNDQFNNYQRATQWVVQLAFTLIASATLTVIVTAVLRR